MRNVTIFLQNSIKGNFVLTQGFFRVLKVYRIKQTASLFMFSPTHFQPWHARYMKEFFFILLVLCMER